MIQPLRDFVLVKLLKEESELDSGLIIPDIAMDRPQFCIVAAVGPGLVDSMGRVKPLGVELGATVFIARYSGTELEDDGEKYLLIKDQNILAVVNQ